MADSPNGSARRDVITDFAHLDDIIGLTAIDADKTTPGNQPFHWVGTAVFSGEPGDLGYFDVGRQHDRPRQRRHGRGRRAADPAHRDEDVDRDRLLPLKRAHDAS